MTESAIQESVAGVRESKVAIALLEEASQALGLTEGSLEIGAGSISGQLKDLLENEGITLTRSGYCLMPHRSEDCKRQMRHLARAWQTECGKQDGYLVVGLPEVLHRLLHSQSPPA